MFWGVLLQSFKEEQFLFCGPIVIVEGEVEAIDDVILCGVLIEVGEAAEAVIRVPSEYLDGLGDIAFALVTLDLVGGVQDVLTGEGST
jgi:hypothetical protein